MRVIIPVNSRNLLKVKSLIEVIHHLGPYKPDDSFVFLTTNGGSATMWPLISHIPQATTAAGLSGTVRRFPTDANELFLESARYAAANFAPDQPWIYMTGEALPLRTGWLTTLEREYLSQPKPILGRVEYLPQKITDSQGVTRVDFGEPYTLETAVYPSDLANRITENLINLNTHHEQIRRRSTAPITHESDLIASAKWKEDLSIAEIPEESVLLVRIYDTSEVARQILTGTPAPIPVPPSPAPPPPPAQVETAPPLPSAAPSLPSGVSVDSNGRVYLGGGGNKTQTVTANQPAEEPAPPAAPPAEQTPLEETPQAVMVIAKKEKKPKKASI